MIRFSRPEVNRRRLWAVAKTEWTHLRRDPQSLAVIFLLPIITLILFGYAINFDLKHIPMAILDRDRTQRSNELREVFQSSEYFRYLGEAADEHQIETLIAQGTARLVVVIPRGFDRDVSAGQPVTLQTIFDGSDGTTAGVALTYAEAQIADYVRRQSGKAVHKRVPLAMRKQPGVEIRPRVLYNPELSSTHYIVPGMLVLILAITAALLTSTSVARERETGTLEQLVVSPVRPLELMAGKLLPYIAVNMADVVVLVLFGWVFFQIWPAGSLWLLFLGSVLFLFGLLGLGLFISVRAPNQAFALQIGFILSLLPTMLLSGFAYPRQSMPDALYYFTGVLPATQFLIVVRAIYLKGTGLLHLWPQFLYLAAVAVLFLRAAAASFVKRLD